MIERFLLMLPTLESVGAIGYPAAFATAFIDGLAFLGLAFPGGAVIIALGALSAKGSLNLGALIWIAAVGAILGDGVSFYLGQRSRGIVRDHTRFFTPARFEKAKRFFTHYGVVSIIFARFISPIRPIIPFVAGLADMPARRFYVVSILSAFAWAATFLTIGYLLGDV